MDLQTLGISPVSTENPAGADIRYTPAFESLQAEIDKLSSPTAADISIDWAKISSMAAEILSSASKDLLAAAYFCVARIHLSGIEGLKLGLQVYSDLLDNFWDSLFPQMRRMRGRIAAIEWWVEKSEIAVGLMKPNRISKTVKGGIIAQCNHVDQILAKYLPDSHPALDPIIRAVEAIPTDTAEKTASPADTITSIQEDALPTPEPHSPSPPAPAASPSDIPSPPQAAADGQGSLDSLLQNLQQTAVALLEKDTSDPLSYRLLRFSLWSTLDNLPSATEGKTLILPPDPQIATILRDLFSRGDWTSVVTASEYQLPQNIFWLDLNRFSALALENLGPPYHRAAECLSQETAFFLARLPDLAALQFSDGTPLADKETVEWLQSISLSPLPPDQTSGNCGAPADPLTIKLSEVMQQAQHLVKSKNIVEAVNLLQQEMRLAYSVKDRMLWRLALCRILIQSKNASLAVSHFDQVLADIQTYRLEEWDPLLALQGLKVVWAGFQKIPDTTAKERGTAVLHQISRIDPVEALRIGK